MCRFVSNYEEISSNFYKNGTYNHTNGLYIAGAQAEWCRMRVIRHLRPRDVRKRCNCV